MRSATMERATFGAGCFWGVETAFRRVKGVTATGVGYMGGSVPNPTYEDVCTDRTGHAEVVQVAFDPLRVTYEQLLDLFWQVHDPTAPRAWPANGKQYRSVIYFHTPEQAAAAGRSKEKAQARFREPIATEIVPASTMWWAGEYHQQYEEKNGVSSCRT
jgi:peptide-methionine (S)-S-oxide reductase